MRTLLVVLVYIIIATDSYHQTSRLNAITHARKESRLMTSQRPINNRDDIREHLSNFLRITLGSGFLAKSVDARVDNMKDPAYKSPPVCPPSDDFWYPPFLIGNWKMNLTFDGARFTNDVNVQKLVEESSIPGFSNYSVIFLADMGKNVSNVPRRYIQLDSHPREDHSYNLRSLLSTFQPDIVVDSAAYSYQKAPNWFYSPSNRWTIKYHDLTANGTVELLTKKRNIKVYAGIVESIEFFKQVVPFTK
jgi:hypothetical protein